MKKLKRLWVSEEAYRRAKIEAAKSDSKLVDYLDKVINEKSESKEDKRGYYGFLK